MGALGDFRGQYPQYSDLSDESLADALHQKYYSDLPKDTVFGKLGVPLPPTAEELERASKPALILGSEVPWPKPPVIDQRVTAAEKAPEPVSPQPPVTGPALLGIEEPTEAELAAAARPAQMTRTRAGQVRILNPLPSIPIESAAPRQPPVFTAEEDDSALRAAARGPLERVQEGVGSGIAAIAADTALRRAERAQSSLEKGLSRRTMRAGRPIPLSDPETAALESERAAAAKESAVARLAGTSYPVSRSMQEIQKAKTFGEAFNAFMQAPIENLVDVTAQNAPNLAIQIGSGLSAGIILGPAGFVLGGSVPDFAINFDSAVGEDLQKAGVDLTNPKAIERALQDRELMALVLDRARKYAAGVTTLDAASMGLATQTLAPSVLSRKLYSLGYQRAGAAGGKEANRFARQAANVGAQVPAQMVLSAGSEIAGQTARSGEVTSWPDVLLETVAEGPGSLAEVASGVGINAIRARRRLEELRERTASAAAAREAAEAALAGGAPVRPPGGPAPGSAEDLARQMEQPGAPLAEQRRKDAEAALTAAQAEEEAAKSEFQREWEAQEADRAAAAAAAQPPAVAAPEGDGTPDSPVIATAPEHVEAAGTLVDTAPTDAQKEAGNYQKAHIDLQGLKISIENPKGSERSGVDADGERWAVVMPSAYGYIKRTEGGDGEQVDVYVGDVPASRQVWVVDQIDPKTGKFDEHKVLLGFPTAVEARRTYVAGFSDGSGESRIGAITHMGMDQFKDWLKTANTGKPVAYIKQKPVIAPAQPGEKHAAEIRKGTEGAQPERPGNAPQVQADREDRGERTGEHGQGDVAGERDRLRQRAAEQAKNAAEARAAERNAAQEDAGGQGERDLAVLRQKEIERPLLVTESATSQAEANAGGVDIQAFRNAIESETFRKHGFRGLNIPMQRTVLLGVLRGAENPEILNAIIPAIPVDVMNYLRGQKSTPEMFLHNESMLSDAFSGNGIIGEKMGVSAGSSLIRIVAERTAKVASVSGDFAGLPVESEAAKGTIDVRHGVTPSSSVVTGGGGVSASPLPTTIPEPVVERIPGEDGMEALIIRTDKGNFRVSLRDAEADETAGFSRNYPSIGTARIAARRLLEGRKEPSEKKPLAADAATLPRDIAGAKPRYNYGIKTFTLSFESDFDRAAYITAQEKRSKRDTDYLNFAMRVSGMSEGQVRAHGASVRTTIKTMARDTKPGELTVPPQRKGVAGETIAPKPETKAPSPRREQREQKKRGARPSFAVDEISPPETLEPPAKEAQKEPSPPPEAAKEPWQMSREEFSAAVRVQRTGADMRVRLPNGETNLVAGTTSISKALADTRKFVVQRAINEGEEVPPFVRDDVEPRTADRLAEIETKARRAAAAVAPGSRAQREQLMRAESAARELRDLQRTGAEATHIEDGKIEEVDGEVIRESVAEASTVTGKPLQQMRDNLIAAINSAIAKLPEDTEAPRAKWVRFDVPGDGVFRVLNNKARLQTFAKQAKGGFTKPTLPTVIEDGKIVTRPTPKWTAGNGTVQSVRDALEEGDLLNGYQMAQSIGVPLAFGVSSKGEHPTIYTNAEPTKLKGFASGSFVVAKGAGPVTRGESHGWRVLETSSGLALGDVGSSAEEAIANAEASIVKAKAEGKDPAAIITKAPNNSQEKLEKAWVKAAQERQDKDLEAGGREVEMAEKVKAIEAGEVAKPATEEKQEEQPSAKYSIPPLSRGQNESITVDVDGLTRGVLARMDVRLKALGYDSRGSDDVREMLKTRIAPDGVITHPDWTAAYEAATKGAQATRERTDAKAAERGAAKYVDFARMRELGLTEDWAEAGYITSGGSLIDLSGKREGGQSGTRSYDHREAGGTAGMQEYMALGNIRIDGNSGSIDIAREPTQQQYRRIAELAEMRNGEVVIDLEDGLGEPRLDSAGGVDYYFKAKRNFSREYPVGAKPARIIADIKRFFSGAEPLPLSKSGSFFVGELAGFSDRYLANEDEIEDGVIALAQQIAPQVNVDVVGELFLVTKEGGRTETAGARIAAQNLIQVALRYEDPQATLRHEAVHSFFDMGLLSGGEKRVLQAKAGEWRKRFDVDTRYLNLAGNEETLNEEGVAHAYGAYRGGEKFGGLIQPAFAKIRRFLQALGDFLRGKGFTKLSDIFPELTVDDVFARMESGEVGRRPVKAATKPVETKFSVGEAPEKPIITRRNGLNDVVTGREQMPPSQATIEYAKRIFDKVGLDVVPRGTGLWEVADKTVEAGVLDDAGYKLLDVLRREIRALNSGTNSPETLGSLVNSVRNYIASDENRGMSPWVRTELYEVSQGEASHRGLMLGALAQVRPDSFQRLARTIDGTLQRVYAEQFGDKDGGVDDIMKALLKRLMEHFMPEELAKLADASPELMKWIEKMSAEAMERDLGGRLYRRIHWLYKDKKPKSVDAMAEDARINEAAQKIIEDLKQFGIEPKPRPGKKSLTALESLILMVSPDTSEAIDNRIGQAISEAERNAGIAASLEDAKPDERALMQEAFRQGLEPTAEMVEKGMQADNFRHWRILRDNLLGYSPTTLKLVQQVIRGEFKGTKFGQPAPKPPDTRIDLNKLAKAPEAEVRRVLDNAIQAIEAEMDLAGATPETRLRVAAMLQATVETQLAAARKRVRDRAIVPPAAPGAKLTAEQRLREQFNAGLLGDPRMSDAQVVARVAQKSMVRSFVPNLRDMMKKVFETPFYRQNELEGRFGRAMAETFKLTGQDRSRAETLFRKAYADQFAKAKARALDAVHKSITPKQQKTIRKIPALWEKIEAAVNAGAFDSAFIMKEVALSRGWVVPTDDQLAEIRDLAEREQRLRELTPAERAAAELKVAAGKGSIGDYERDKAAATISERAHLKREMQALWLRWTAPLGWKTVEGRRNVARAVNEVTSANLLLRPGFFVRQLIDVATQTAIHTPTRAAQEAIRRYQADKVVAGRETRLWRDVGQALQDAYAQRAKALRAALAATRRGLAGRSETKNVEQILDNISIFDRAELKADELAAQGKTAQAFMVRLANHFAFAFRYAKALDELQGVLAEAQEMHARTVTELREHGLTPEQASESAEWVMSDTKAEFVLALARTEQILTSNGVEATPVQIEQAAWDVVKSRQYGRIEALQIDAEDLQAENRVLRNVIGWNEREMGGLGGVVAGFGRAITQLSEQVGLPMPLARFSNAIGISINRVLTFTPLGFFSSAFKGSAWYRTERDIMQRKIEAAAGTSVGLVLWMLVLAGVLVPRFKWPDDEAERQVWNKIGRQPGTVEIMIGGGKYITISMTVGPFSFVRPWLVFAGSLKQSAEKHEEKSRKLARRAAESGLQPAMVEQKSAEALYAAYLAAFSAFLGGRTAVGIISNLTDYRTPQPARATAGVISPLIPGAPQWQEISRMANVQLDPKRASVLDFVFPVAGSEAEKRNFFYDPLNEQTTERIVKVLTGSTWPLATLPIHKDTEAAYRVLYETGWRPPIVQNQAREIGDQFRAFDQEELEKYREFRGRYLKQAIAGASLSGLSETDKLDELDALAQEANQDAVDDVIDMIESRTGGTGKSSKIPVLKPFAPREIRP